ncbi:Zn-dependent hydrolase [Flagellimonas aequoris]|uniref:Zn-dependent hydrolase n=1 Tax=Flagellimonas aequoris TaxID=2306997 RepID=A0A418N7H6_9FLAO|nr:Zn-dependent hydrolase [Allomuricauda aequoris]RIV70868.1 Zn-dependent hydrolase [Allomuricauda aequoris]TXK02305.1 Zn-dependent hydrolase [Allomuricauda aequoris]
MFSRSIFLICFFTIGVLSAQKNNPKVDQARLEKRIFDLAKFGLQENGETERVAFSDADIEARNWVVKTLKGFGMTVTIDAAGNIIGKKPGKDASKKPIAFGSHIDRVPHGGNYDGCVGSMAALEVIETLIENNIKTKHPLEVIIFPNEEGGVMGSRAMAGNLTKAAFPVVNATGYSMGEGIMRIGGDTTKIKDAIRETGSLAAFLELHIEQGGKLEKANLDIGVVEGIVGLKWWDVVFTGFANHAGTTPMNARQDALLAAAKFIVAVNEITNGFEGTQVGTVGRIRAEPGAPNVIPGKVVASLEIRDLSAEVIEKVYQAIKKKTEEIAEASHVSVEFLPLDTTSEPALTDPSIQKEIESSAKALGLTFQYMPSGAGHDSQDVSRFAPVGMIFVPSKGGISHSPKEFTSAEDMANGANVLLNTVLALDKKLD